MAERRTPDERSVETLSPLRQPQSSGRLVLVAFCEENTSVFELAGDGPVTIGRAPECELQIDHPSVSRQHARVYLGTPLTIEDLGSRNGTRIRGVLIAQKTRAPLHAGDVVECGDALLIVRNLALDAPGTAREAVAAATAQVRSLEVGADARWFQPIGGERVNLGRGGPLRRVLLALAEERVDRPNVGLSLDAVISSGWPGEKMLHEAGLARVYTTVQRLRALGLASVLLTRDDGYLLDPGVDLRLER